MRVLVTGCCGFTGFRVLQHMADAAAGSGQRCELFGIDNLARPGSELRRRQLADLGITFRHGDLRLASDLDALPEMDWVIDAAANPSVLAGTDGRTGPRQLIEHNLLGTVNLLELCRRSQAGLLLLSTSRVYSIEALKALPLDVVDRAFAARGEVSAGITESFSTAAPISLYGATKLASEALALEYHAAFGLPVWINRCGVLAGEGQYGKPDQGIVAFWIHSWQARRALRYFGYQGSGHQTRDCLHPDDLAALLWKQMTQPVPTVPRVVHVAGGLAHHFSLRQLSDWCVERFGPHTVEAVPEARSLDVPWLLLDSTVARSAWDWAPRISRDEIFDRIADFAESHPDWLSLSADE